MSVINPSFVFFNDYLEQKQLSGRPTISILCPKEEVTCCYFSLKGVNFRKWQFYINFNGVTYVRLSYKTNMVYSFDLKHNIACSIPSCSATLLCKSSYNQIVHCLIPLQMFVFLLPWIVTMVTSTNINFKLHFVLKVNE